MRPTPLAINRPIRIFGFPPKALTFVLVFVAIAIMTPIPKILVAVLGIAAVFTVRYFSKDPVGLLVWLRAFFQCAKYEPTQRKIFRMAIEP
jgi:type IV secretory pathway VirB3-like protein